MGSKRNLPQIGANARNGDVTREISEACQTREMREIWPQERGGRACPSRDDTRQPLREGRLARVRAARPTLLTSFEFLAGKGKSV